MANQSGTRVVRPSVMRILKLLSESPSMSNRELVDATGYTYVTIVRQTSAMIRAGILLVDLVPAERGMQRRMRLSKRGKEFLEIAEALEANVWRAHGN